MRTGISIYFGSGIAVSERVIARAAQAGVDYAFTSMHIPEEDGAALAGDARHLLGMLREAGIGAIVDVGPETCAKLGCESLEGLADLGVTHLRLDYGFTAAETASLARTFHIVCNASTVTKADIASWRAAGADLARFTACHNYYPKPGTGLDLDEVRRMNDLLSAQGFEVLGFVPGDGVLRGPLHEGLSTIEEHRARRTEIARNMLELGISGGCDGVLVGDVDLTASGWEALSQVAAGSRRATATFSGRSTMIDPTRARCCSVRRSRGRHSAPRRPSPPMPARAWRAAGAASRSRTRGTCVMRGRSRSPAPIWTGTSGRM